ncbi:MAG TPA: PPC domain-containing DNA-binding protein [Ideonella sp.]|uniref:PPC domain-containing DNA-binding protein n=1 Tax=Ideonella sp. TaxID=1929293 RepID=UPI002B592942|nr:PPC domain-containing DNA-binding protein [Ideonella sp.]HSI51742.1 PPC domain-containing DNA-binding protein [Ideonella sp.]
MQLLPLRLSPGADLRQALEDAARRPDVGAAFVVCGIGSLTQARLRFAQADTETAVEGPLEILSLSGSLAENGVHLHMAVSRADGTVLGGHVGHGNIVRTTAEVLLALLPEWQLTRELDPHTGYLEMVARRRAPGQV